MNYSELIWQIPILVLLMNLYLLIAKRFHIFDKPNERSSHQQVIISGGGIVIYFSLLISKIYLFEPYFFVGITILAVISFWDDLKSISVKWRILIHLISVILLFWELNLFQLGWWIPILAIFTVGILNAFNFMDGINGINGLYSLVFLGSALFLEILPYDNLILLVISSLLILGYFNFRQKAACFGGDIGSFVIAYFVIFLLIQIVMITGNFVFILMLAVYGVDTVWTIIIRLYHKENIFRPHRSHLYQLLANEYDWPHLLVAIVYGVLQIFINCLVFTNFQSDYSTWPLIITTLVVLSVIRLSLKKKQAVKLETDES